MQTSQRNETHLLDVGEAPTLSELVRIGRVLQVAARSTLWFRGHADKHWTLQPKLFRDGYDHKAEREMLGAFSTQARSRHSPCPAPDNRVAWLCWAQHYGLPTRLLDWSGSLLVAAYFAVEDESHDGKDAAIWVTSQGIINYYLTGRSPSSALHEGHLDSRQTFAAVAVSAPEPEMRMFLQQGAFTYHRDQRPLEVIPEARKGLHRILIPQTRKDQLRCELSSICGITRATIFPELQHLAEHLKANTVRNTRSFVRADSSFDENAINVPSLEKLTLDAEYYYDKQTPKPFSQQLDELAAYTTSPQSVPYIVTNSSKLTSEPVKGRRVKVVKGWMTGFDGIIEKYDSSKDIAEVVFNLFGLKEVNREMLAEFRKEQFLVLD